MPRVRVATLTLIVTPDLRIKRTQHERSFGATRSLHAWCRRLPARPPGAGTMDFATFALLLPICSCRELTRCQFSQFSQCLFLQ